MVRYVIRRLLWAVVLFLAITILTFVMFYVILVNPAALVAGRTLHVEQEVGHVSVLHLVLLALEPEQAGLAAGSHGLQP